ncbi:MAG: LysR family transcriptional regulator [Pseudomonadota bacterium]
MASQSSHLSIRIDLPSGQRFGPGKAALLRALREAGSIRAAAETLGMSYPRALKLIEQMNASFRTPLVETQHGGSSGGGAFVTLLGDNVLSLYEDICMAANRQNTTALTKIMALLAE